MEWGSIGPAPKLSARSSIGRSASWRTFKPLISMFCVYVLFNEQRKKIYIGYTENLEERLARHNRILPSKKTSFTYKMSGLWKVVYSEKYATRKEAMKREKELKSFQGRKFIWQKIKDMPS